MKILFQSKRCQGQDVFSHHWMPGLKAHSTLSNYSTSHRLTKLNFSLVSAVQFQLFQNCQFHLSLDTGSKYFVSRNVSRFLCWIEKSVHVGKPPIYGQEASCSIRSCNLLMSDNNSPQMSRQRRGQSLRIPQLRFEMLSFSEVSK
jgi:hypothetical protein